MIQLVRNLTKKIRAGDDELSSGVLNRALKSEGKLKYFFLFLVLGVGFALLTSFFIYEFNGNPSASSLIAILAIISLFSFFLIFQALFVKNFQFYLWVSLLEACALFWFFYQNLSPILVFAGIVFVWSLLNVFYYARRFLKQRIDFSFFRFAQVVSTQVLRAFVLFLAIFYFGLYANFGLSKAGFSFALDLSTPFIDPFVPGFSSEMNANDFYVVFAKEQIEKKFSDTHQFQSLTVAQKEEAIIVSAREMRNKVGELTSTTVEPSDRVSDYFYKIALNYMPKVEASPIGAFSSMIFVLAIYSVLAMIALVMRVVLIVPISWVVYQALYGLGIVKIKKEMVEKDTLFLS